LSCCPRNPHGPERALKEEEILNTTKGAQKWENIMTSIENAILIRLPKNVIPRVECTNKD